MFLRRMLSAAALLTGALLLTAPKAEAQGRFQATAFAQGGLLDPDYSVALGGGANLGVHMARNIWLEGDIGAVADRQAIERSGATRHYRGSVMAVWAPVYGAKEDWGIQLGLGGTYQDLKIGSRSVREGFQIGTMAGARYKLSERFWLRTDAVVDIKPDYQDVNGMGRVGLQVRF